MHERVCDLCRATPVRPGAAINFHNPHAERSVTLSLLLCPTCADRTEKHLKRMIPKRRFLFVP